MSLVIPIIFLGAFLEAILSIVDKKIINSKINFRNYVVYIFLTIVLTALPLVFFFWNIKPGALELKNLVIFMAIVIISIFANFFVFYSLTREDLSELQPIRLTTPLFSILMALVFSFFFNVYENERNYSIIILSLIASITLIVAHTKRHHLYLNKYAISAVIGSFLFALELVLSKPLLNYYNPITLYFLRSLWIFIITWAVFHRKLTSVKQKIKFLILALGILAVFMRIVLYYGYQTLGIVFTTTIFISSTVLIYIFAWSFLKEKITLRQIISSMVIVVCVIASVFLNN